MSLFESASLVVTPNGTKASKLYAIKPTDGSGDLTVVRATSATRVNSSGLIESVASNVPRLDYTNSTCPSILVEPQRTNLQTYSEDFSNAVFIKVGATVTTNTTASPDGTTTGDKLVEDTSTGLHTAAISAGQATGGDYTLSVFVKASGRTKFQLAEGFSIGGNVNFDLTAGTATTTAPAKNGRIENYGNGWYKCSATWTFTGGSTTVLYLNLLNDAGSNSYLGNGTSGVNLWGAQLEVGSNATSYIPTTTASVTRNADNIDLLNSGILPTSYPFTILTKAKYSLKEQYFVLSFLDTTSASSYFSLRFLSNKINALIRPNLTEILVTSTSNFNEGDLVNIVLKVTSSQIKLFVNGQIESTATNTLPFNTSINDLTLGRLRVVSDTSTRIGNNLVSIWNQELTDQECINLTTI
jgi:hypothetical protein